MLAHLVADFVLQPHELVRLKEQPVGVGVHQEVSISRPAATAVLYFAIPYVTVTFAGAIVLYQLALAYGTRPRPEDLLSPRLRAAGYVERGLALTVVLFFTPAFWAVAAV